VTFSAMSYVMSLHQGTDGTPLNPAEKLILILLSDGWSFDESEATDFSFLNLAYDAEMDAPELLKHLLHLEELGVLTVQPLPQPQGRATHRCQFQGSVAALGARR
jgi:hypothetical protein